MGALWSCAGRRPSARSRSPAAGSRYERRSGSTERGPVAGRAPRSRRRLPPPSASSASPARCGWLTMYVGLDWIHDRGPAHGPARRPTGSPAIDGVELLTPRDRDGHARDVPDRAAGPPQTALDELGRADLRDRPDHARPSTRCGSASAFFTTEEELERFAAAVELLAAHTPETLPPRRALTILGERLSGSMTGARGQRRPAAGPPALVGRGPLAPVPERAAAGRPGRAGEPRGRDRPGARLSRLRRRARARRRPARRRPADCSPRRSYVLVVLVVGSVVTCLVVPLASGAPATRRRGRRGARRSGSSRPCRSPTSCMVVVVQILGRSSADRSRPARGAEIVCAGGTTFRVCADAMRDGPFVPFRGTLRPISSSCGRVSGRRRNRGPLILVAIDEQHVALPKLYGAPAYARPPRPVGDARRARSTPTTCRSRPSRPTRSARSPRRSRRVPGRRAAAPTSDSNGDSRPTRRLTPLRPSPRPRRIAGSPIARRRLRPPTVAARRRTRCRIAAGE